MECSKRQKAVLNGEAAYRCINRDCEAWGQAVNDEACSLCPVRVMLRAKKGCKGKPDTSPVTESLEQPPVETLDAIPDYPAMSLQMWLYKEALLRWNRAGRPVRSAEEVDNILTTHCKECDWYDASAKRCKGCGCKVTTSSVAIFNKLKMATEKCPKGLW